MRKNNAMEREQEFKEQFEGELGCREKQGFCGKGGEQQERKDTGFMVRKQGWDPRPLGLLGYDNGAWPLASISG